ncbi:hypothetical protein ACFL6S_01720 [Candidatus Poribacteria bacterium]
MRLFKRKKEESRPQRHELCDIPVGSMIELSDTTTFALEEKTTQTFELKAYKKYEAEGFLRYMYQLVDDEEVVLGVNMDPDTGEHELARFVIDSEEEFAEALGDSIMMEFDDPENEGETVQVEYNRDNIVSVKMTVVSADGAEEYHDIELQEYSAEDGSILSAELWESWFTFYIGELIERTDVNVFPMESSSEEE